MELANHGKDLETTMVDPGSVLTDRAMSSAILPQQTIPLNKLLNAPVDYFNGINYCPLKSLPNITKPFECAYFQKKTNENLAAAARPRKAAQHH
jgi:hypothetical protein